MQHDPQICHRIKVLFISLLPHLCGNTAAIFADSDFTFWRMHIMLWPTNPEHKNASSLYAIIQLNFTMDG